LPPGIRDFSGRKAETHALATGLTEIRSGPGQVRLAVVSGSGGAGKTALATHVAHLISARFPDGNLYADLRGTDSTPCDPAGVLADWLHALGENEDQIAHSIDARAARFRSLTRDRRLLLLLDDTRDYAQIRPLLPAAETCAVLVTSRSRVASLDGAMRLDLGPMTESDAAATLDRMAGDARLAAEPLATKAILNSCAGHPLALRIAGARLSARPAWRVEALARRLADPRRVLDELALEDVSVRASFEASYTMLDATGQPVSARCAFRLLGLTAGTDISLPMAAALFGIDEAGAEQILETLVDAHLLDAPEAGQYRIHHLIRLCAAERADGDETPAARAAARQRLSQWHATACSEVLGANLLT
jgi:NB-ARC domain